MFGKSVRIIFMLIVFACFGLYGQNNFFAYVKDKESNKPLEGANVYISGLQKGASSDSSGAVRIENIPAGTWHITFSFVGYHEEEREFVFPMQEDGLIIIYMEHAEEELEEVVVRSTRGSRTIADEPERVEVISGEELDEKISMEASSISMLLNESPGIQVQQISQNSGATYFRIQGLDGKYTRLLSDGMPSFGGLESGLSLLQVTPLDLQGVEIIKGSTSTLYGGGAIAGVINLISKDPSEDIWSFLLNRTSARGTDASIYRTDILGNFGYTFIANGNFLQAYDADHDGVTEIPFGRKMSASAKMEYTVPKALSLSLRYGFMDDERRGGDFNAAKNNLPEAEQNTAVRNSLSLNTLFFTGSGKINYKSSGSIYRREISIDGKKQFGGLQNNTFNELSYTSEVNSVEYIAGVSLQTEGFKEDKYGNAGYKEANYHYVTPGIFLQATGNASDKISLTLGLRGERNNIYKEFLLPRAAFLYKPENNLAFRLSAGLGYKVPEFFTEVSEFYLPNNVEPPDYNNLSAEKSRGVSFDVNYRSVLSGTLVMSANILLYYTEISSPIRYYDDPRIGSPVPVYIYQNYAGKIESPGFEITVKTDYKDFSLFTGHSVSATQYSGSSESGKVPYNPQHKSYVVVMYEEEGAMRLGFEAYYTGRQFNLGGEKLPDYWIFGFMAERQFGPAGLFINFENFTDVRQSRFGIPVHVAQTGINSGYTNIFAPLDGFIANAGVKLRF